MKEQKLQVFVNIVKHYFNQFGSDEVLVDTPYLLENKLPHILEYTGVIGISGVQKGVVYMTASKALLIKALSAMGEVDRSDENCIDLVGEVANTISGNARQSFGSEFYISVPFVFKGAPQSVILPRDGRSFIIPIKWQDESGEIVVCLQS